MPSISHRTSLGPGAPHRAKSCPAALPAGFIRAIGGFIRWCTDRLEVWRELRQLRELDHHLLCDIGLAPDDARRSTIFNSRRHRDARDPKGPPTWPTTS